MGGAVTGWGCERVGMCVGGAVTGWGCERVEL